MSTESSEQTVQSESPVLNLCPICKESIFEGAIKCKHCKSILSSPRSGEDVTTIDKCAPVRSGSSGKYGVSAAVAEKSSGKGSVVITSGTGKIIGWFALANFAVMMSIVIISGGAAAGVVPYILLIGCIAPFIMLFMSKWLAKRAHDIRLIDPNKFQNDREKSLYQLVDTLRAQAGLEVPLEVGIYESDDMNAFATGPGKKSSMLAFSTGLLEQMDDQAVTAVAAHEMAHIANSDMLILTLVQSVVNAVVLLISLPFRALKIATFFSDNASWVDYLLATIVHVLITSVLMFLGNIVVKAFSRQREFRADKLAGMLVGNPYMIHALQILQGETASAPARQVAYAAFKINSPPSWSDIFSTHPSLERRIAALEESE